METTTTHQLVEAGALPPPVLAACLQCIEERRNLLVAGPTGAGKTNLLQALSRHIPSSDSVLVIDAGGGVRVAEAGWRRVEWRREQARESFRDATRGELARAAASGERPRLIADGVGAPEAADILEALESGRGGSLIATQGTGIEDALLRLASGAAESGPAIGRAVRLVAAGIYLVIHLDRDHSGARGVERGARLTRSGDGWKTRLLWQESAFDNGLRAGELVRLAGLSEECAEAIQAVAKILRHGWESRDPIDASSPTNRQMLETELGDLRFAVAALTQAGDVSAERIADAAIGRAADPGRYMHHQGRERADRRAACRDG